MQVDTACVQAEAANPSAVQADCRLRTRPEAVSATGCPAKTPVTHMCSVAETPSIGIPLLSISLPASVTSRASCSADESRALFVLMSDSAHADLGLGQALGSALRKFMAALPAPKPISPAAAS